VVSAPADSELLIEAYVLGDVIVGCKPALCITTGVVRPTVWLADVLTNVAVVMRTGVDDLDVITGAFVVSVAGVVAVFVLANCAVVVGTEVDCSVVRIDAFVDGFLGGVTVEVIVEGAMGNPNPGKGQTK